MTTHKHGWDKNHFVYHCSDGEHPSFHKTIIESEEWKAWEEVQMERHRKCKCFDNGGKSCDCGIFDVDESRECNWFSPEHFKAFLEFIVYRY